MSGFICNECGWHGEEPGRIKLYAIPDMGEFNLVVCPSCRYLESSIQKCCDEPGCTRETSQGFPTADGGYRQTCYEHGPKGKK
jgi:hypothetical protein